MATVNKASLRTEFDALKARFESLCAEGKMPPESRALVDALLMLFELLMAVFMEKHTPKSPANSGLPPSQSPNDATARTRPGAKGKTPFVAAVETNAEGHPLRVKLTVVEGFRLTEIAAWAQQHLSPGTQVLSDVLACFNGVTAAGCVHEPMVTGGGKAAVERPEFRWVNTILGNIKNALCGTYHAVRPKYAQRYLAEFEYRFNRRFDLPDIIPQTDLRGAANPADAGTAAQVTLGLSGNQVVFYKGSSQIFLASETETGQVQIMWEFCP